MDQKIRTTFLESNMLSDLAWNAVKRSATDPDQALVVILFGCACVESVLNELLYELKRPTAKGVPNRHVGTLALLQEAGVYEDRVPFDKKLRLLGFARTGSAINRGASPYQEFALLVSLQNWIVHLQPEETVVTYGSSGGRTRLVADRPHKWVTELQRRGVIDIRQGPSGPSLALALRTECVAQWAYCSAYSMLAEIGSWFPEWRSRFDRHARPKPGCWLTSACSRRADESAYLRRPRRAADAPR